MKQVLTLIMLAIAAGAAVAADNYATVFKAQGSYADVRDFIRMGIESEGLVINNTGHIADMLERTGKDVGASKQVYTGGEQFEFCSATLSRTMMEADPHAIALCPFVISVYQLPNDKTVYVSYRKPAKTKNPELRKALGDIEKLQVKIIQGAIQ
ncbi:DUF302 domain-containing protein [Betaproteobacteria bacterium SCN2]|nr:DUF302 domain-containing protein [Betaproteobacteria bacterium SCN2]